MTKLIKVPIYIDKEYGRSEKHRQENPDGSIEWVSRYKTTRIENPYYFNLKREYFSLVDKYRENKSEEFAGGMPSTMERDCLSQLLRTDHDNNLVYGITLKVDGERYLMFLSLSGEIFFIDRAMIFYHLDPPVKRILTSPFLIDGEMVYNGSDHEFLIFDILFYNGESCIPFPYYRRYDIANYAIQRVLKDLVNVSLKPWVLLNEMLKTNDIYSHILKITNGNRRVKLNADGLILQPLDTPYVPFGPWNRYNNVVFKWKPPEDLTIDFQIKIVSVNEWELLTRTGMNYDIPQGDDPPVHAICIPTESNKREYHDGDVAEFRYRSKNNPQGNKFVIMRPRPEKNANSLNTIMSTMNVIHNPFDLDILKPAIQSINTGKDVKSQLMQYSQSNLILCMLKDSIFFTKYESSEIKKIYLMQLGNRELEFRLLKNSKNIDKFTFYYLFDFFNQSYKGTREYTIDIIETNYSENKVNRSTYLNMESIKNGKPERNESKTKIKDFTITNESKLYNNLNCKLQLSQEIPSTKIITKGTIREKDRQSYIIGLWRIDITRVMTNSTKESYEIECEFLNSNVSFEEFIKSFSDIYILILKNSSYC
jgi:hypothetical protein